jgi:hypothetical protein
MDNTEFLLNDFYFMERNNSFKFLPQFYFDDDTLFHYTNEKNGSSIINSKKLRFSNRIKSKDPVESLKIRSHTISFSYSDEETLEIDNKTEPVIQEVDEILNEMFNHTKQICFCKNDVENKILGFLKPRMWNQYGDDYQGINLIFSKKKLLEEKLENMLFDDVIYSDYSKFNLDFGINQNQILELGREEFLNKYFEKINYKLFLKHYDYKGENEYRMIIKSKNELEEINIEKSLLGVLLSVKNFEEEKLKIELFENLCKLNNIDLKIIYWKNDGVEILPKNPYSDVHKIRL